MEWHIKQYVENKKKRQTSFVAIAISRCMTGKALQSFNMVFVDYRLYNMKFGG